jgi:septum formation protein
MSRRIDLPGKKLAMMEPGFRIVLGSRSPRRLDLLKQVVPASCIEVVPPRSTHEAGFDDLIDWTAIEARLIEIARRKLDDVLDQLRERPTDKPGRSFVIAADTVIIAAELDGRLRVLGQPPETPTWKETVRFWFREYYTGKTHRVATALFVADSDGVPIHHLVTSEVTFSCDVERWLDWYLDTGEPLGKAGGYAIQGAGSLFVTRVEGSLSNIAGLPLGELIEILQSAAPGDRG